jgi:hypothetical protein
MKPIIDHSAALQRALDQSANPRDFVQKADAVLGIVRVIRPVSEMSDEAVTVLAREHITTHGLARLRAAPDEP